MKTLIKTLAVLTAGVGAVAVVKRVSEKIEILNHKSDSTNGAVSEALSLAKEAKVLATEALDKATKETKGYTRENHRESIRIVTNGKQATLSVQRPCELFSRILLAD